MVEKDKKKFKDTKLGKFLATAAPKVLDVVGDVLPDKGVLGIVKNIVNMATDIPPEQKAAIMQQVADFEMEMEKLLQEDRASARNREIEMAKTGRHDFLMYVVGLIILIAFTVVVYASVFMDVRGETFVRISTMVETLTVAIVSYYFGSSKGSADKTKILNA